MPTSAILFCSHDRVSMKATQEDVPRGKGSVAPPIPGAGAGSFPASSTSCACAPSFFLRAPKEITIIEVDRDIQVRPNHLDLSALPRIPPLAVRVWRIVGAHYALTNWWLTHRLERQTWSTLPHSSHNALHVVGASKCSTGGKTLQALIAVA